MDIEVEVRSFITDEEYDKLIEFMKKNSEFVNSIKSNDLRKIHLEANKLIYLKKDCFVHKKIREKLGLTQREVAINIREDKNNIGNYERGLVITPNIKNKIHCYLKSFKNYSKYKIKAEKDFLDYKRKWDYLSTFNKFIKVKGEPVKGYFLERSVEKILIKDGWFVLKNVVIADATLDFKQEVDVFAVKETEELAIECKDTRMVTKWDDVAENLKQIRDCKVNKVVYLSPYVSKLGKKVLNANNIIALKPNELKSYLNEVCNETNHRS